MILNAQQIKDYIGKLADALTKKQADIIESVASLLNNEGKANLKQVIDACFPGKKSDEALNSLRGVRKKINDSASQSGIEFIFCVTDDKRSGSEQRFCWFEGADLSREKMEQMQQKLLSNNIEYQAKDFTRPLGRSPFRIFVSSSDNKGEAKRNEKERVAVENFLRCLRHTLKAMGRSDLANGIYHFREQQDNMMLKRIESAMDICDIGLLLISKPYLASEYVKTVELPRFTPAAFLAGTPGVKDVLPILFSPCFGNDPAKINELLGLEEGGGLQVIRYQEKLAFTECDEQTQERFVEVIADRLCKKLPPYADPGEPASKRWEYLIAFTRRQHDKLNKDSSYPPTEWESTKGECCKTGRAGTSTSPVTEVDEQPRGFDALARLITWAKDPDAAHVHALLGDLGSGKTFTCRMLAINLLKERLDDDNSILLPIYIDLREVGFTTEWQGSPTLDQILSGWLKHWHLGVNPDDAHSLDVEAVKRLSDAGAIWIFDGFDEISTHLPRNTDSAFFKELLRPVAPINGRPSRSKVLISCRSHYFPTLSKQNATLLEEARGILLPGSSRALDPDTPELICDNTLLLPFDEEQIRNYLCRTLGDVEAERAMEAIAGIHDLAELSRQPYLLRLIRGQIAQLEAMKSQGKPVNAASLYGLFVTDWLQRDEGKHTIEPEDKLRLMERLAAQMWGDRKRGWSFEELQRWVLTQMEAEPDWRFRYQPYAELIAKDLHTAAFVVRYGECSFRFIHTSIQEYFVAAHLLRGLRELRLEHWNIAKISRETLSFLADLWRLCPSHEHAALLQTQKRLHATPPSPAAALLALDYLLAARGNGWPHLLPDNLDLSGTDIGQRTLAGQADQPWRMEILRLNGTNAPQLNMKHLAVRRLEACEARLAGSRWEQCTIDNATLTQTDLGGAKIRHCRWQVTSIDQAILRQAELRLTRFDIPPTTNASTIIGPAWWLSQEPAPAWAVSPHVSHRESPLYFTKIGHSVGTNSVAWRSDGRRLASAGWDSTVRIWEPDTGACLMTLEGHKGGINSVAWNSDCRRLASGGRDSTVRVWDVDTGACLMTLEGHVGGISSVVWNSDGHRLASAGWDSTVRTWDADTGACLMTLEGSSGNVSSVAWDRNGRRLASAGNDCAVRIWDAETGACLMTLSDHEGWISSVAWDSDGRRLASAGRDGTVRIWEADTGACIMTLEELKGEITSMAWNSDGRRLTSAGDDSTVRIWDSSTGACLMTLEGHVGGISSVAWNSDGRRLASAGWDSTVRIWEAETGACLMALEGNTTYISNVAWRKDGQQIAVAGRNSMVRILDPDTGACLMTLKGSSGNVSSVAWDSDGRRLASAGNDCTVRIWDAETGECLMTLSEHEGWISSVAWDIDGRRLASAGRDGTVRIWDADTGACIMTLEEHKGQITSVAWNCDGRRLTSAGDDSTVRIWDSNTGACLMTLEGHVGGISSVAWNSDGHRLVSAGRDGTVRIWEADTGACLMTLEGHSGNVSSVSWHCDGSRLASAGNDCTVRVWEAETGACIMTLEGHKDWINIVAWRNDGCQLVSAGWDNAVRIWEADTGILVHQYIAVGYAEVVLNAHGEVLKANDAAWPYLARLGINPETGTRIWIPAEVAEIAEPTGAHD